VLDGSGDTLGSGVLDGAGVLVGSGDGVAVPPLKSAEADGCTGSSLVITPSSLEALGVGVGVTQTFAKMNE
jgi:hypothetical protein